MRALLLLRNGFQQFVQFFIRQVFFFRFIVDGEQINGSIGNNNVCNNSSTTAFTLAFRSNGNTNFKTTITNSRSLFRIFF